MEQTFFKHNRTLDLIAAPFTPFHTDASIAYERVSAYVAYLKKQAVSGVFICGTTGEGMSLSIDERKTLAESWANAIGGAFKLIVHVGHASLDDACALAAHAASLEVDGIAAIGSTFFQPSSKASLVEVNRRIAAEAPATRFYYYHMPSMSRVGFLASELLPLMLEYIPTFAGIKFTDEDIEDFRKCVERSPAGVKLYFGRDEILLQGLEAGAHGAVGSTYNYRTDIYGKIIEAFFNSDMKTANEAQNEARRYIEMFQRYGGLNAGKALMKMCGVDCGAPRLPLESLTADNYQKMFMEFQNLGFFR